MKKFIPMLFILALVLPSLGCFHNRVIVSPDYNPSKTTPDHEAIFIHLFSIIPLSSNVDLNQVCPNGAGIVEHRGLLYGQLPIDFGQVRVYCQGARTDLDGDVPTMASLQE